MQIPLAVGLVGRDGKDLNLTSSAVADGATTTVVELRKSIEQVVFENIAEPPLPSINRGFSAPVTVKIDLDDVANIRSVGDLAGHVKLIRQPGAAAA